MKETVARKMRKLDSSVDVIPIIQGTSGSNVPELLLRKKPENKDPNFVFQQFKSRVQKYLSANENKERIDLSDISESLMKNYPDYNSLDPGMVSMMVRRAYEDLCDSLSKRNMNLDRIYDDDEEEEDEEDDDEIEIQSDGEMVGDVLGDELLGLFKNTAANNKNGNTGDKELIDISSDDDNAAGTEGIPAEKTKNNTVPPPQPVRLRNPNYNHNAIKRKNSSKPLIPDLILAGDIGKKRQRDKTSEQIVPWPPAKKRKNTSCSKSRSKRQKFCDIGCNPEDLKSIVRLLKHVRHPEVSKHLHAPVTRGILLHGPPGCGKTLLAHAIAGELNVPLIKISALELIAKIPGEGKLRVRELFQEALALAPSVLFFDELDALVPNQKNPQWSIATQLSSCLDELIFDENGDKIIVLGATSRVESIDPELRLAGRFDNEVSISIPDKNCRTKILEMHCKHVPLSGDVDLSVVADKTAGFVGANLVSLIGEAATAAVDRFFNNHKNKNKLDLENVGDKKSNNKIIPMITDVSESSANDKEAESTTGNETAEEKEKPQANSTEDCVNSPQPSTNETTTAAVETEKNELKEMLEMLHAEVVLSNNDLQNLKIENIDFEAALKIVRPYSKGSSPATASSTTWNDIGSLKEIREELQMALLGPVKYPDNFTALGYTPATTTGVLLCGPPGCGKTLLAKAIGNEPGMNFIPVEGLVNEEEVKQCFSRARDMAPCVLFFDNIDALCPRRTEDNSSTLRVVKQILTEMDDVDGRKGVYILAATNRPDILDPAVMRPGRFDTVLYVGLPTPEERVDVLRVLTKDGTVPRVADDVSLEEIGKSDRCGGYSGADLLGLVKQAVNAAVRESIRTDSSGVTQVHMRHFEAAFSKVHPSVSGKEVEYYEELQRRFGDQK